MHVVPHLIGLQTAVKSTCITSVTHVVTDMILVPNCIYRHIDICCMHDLTRTEGSEWKKMAFDSRPIQRRAQCSRLSAGWYLPRGTGEHVLVTDYTEFRGIALNGLFCAELMCYGRSSSSSSLTLSTNTTLAIGMQQCRLINQQPNWTIPPLCRLCNAAVVDRGGEWGRQTRCLKIFLSAQNSCNCFTLEGTQHRPLWSPL